MDSAEVLKKTNDQLISFSTFLFFGDCIENILLRFSRPISKDSRSVNYGPLVISGVIEEVSF